MRDLGAMLASESRPLWTRAKWTLTVIGVVACAGLFVANRLTGGSADTDRDLVLVLGAVLSLGSGGTAYVDGVRARSAVAVAHSTPTVSP